MENGLIHIYTGKGKGKTTAALGLAFRALGYNKKVYFLQFLKGRETGEKKTAAGISGLTFARVNKTEKFVFQMNEEEKRQLQKEVKNVWNNLEVITRDSSYEIIILDEIMGALSNNIVELKNVIRLINNKADDKELILTGRGVPRKLIELADYVTEMNLIKHPYDRNIPAREGIEF